MSCNPSLRTHWNQTDGFSDNVSKKEILEIISSDAATDMSILTATLSQTAQTIMQSSSKETPFQIEAAKEGYIYRGGKEDDVCVFAVHCQIK